MLIFLIIFFIGFALLVLSLIFGHDFDHDIDIDVDSDVHGPSIFSVKMISLLLLNGGMTKEKWRQLLRNF